MGTYHTTATLEASGTLTLTHLPFQAGERVEVVVVAAPTVLSAPLMPLQGTLLHYDHPTDPVAEEDWEAAG